MNKQAGFTLIELVLVIVILGILAATALPRFSDLSQQAREASLNGLAGGLRSASSIAHATQLANSAASNVAVSMDGQSIAMNGGWPTTANISNAIVDFTGFTYNGSGLFTLVTGYTVQYTNGGTGSFPTITVASGSC